MKAILQDQEPPRWDDVKIFLAAYRLLSIGQAAARLGVDTSTVSRRVAAFEQSLGVKLFERTREGLLRTRGAEQVFEAAEAMETAQARLTRDASDIEARAEGTVRLTLDPGLAEFLVAPALPRFRAAHPRIDLELDASPIQRDLRRREADLALRSTKIEGAELVATKLQADVWVPVASSGLARKLGTLRSWNDAEWIAWDRDMANFAPAQWLGRHVPAAVIPLRTNHFASQIVAAEAGLGLALMPLAYASRRSLQRVRTGRALATSVEDLPRGELWLVGHRVMREVPRVAAVWAFLLEELRVSSRGV